MEQLLKRWRLTSPPTVSALIVLLVVAFCLVFELSTLTFSRLAPGELSNLFIAHTAWHDAFNTPYFVLLKVMRHIAGPSIFYSRLVTAGCGFTAALCLYYAAHNWFGWRLAAMLTLLFGTSSYFLYAARLVDPHILQTLALAGLVALFCSLKQPSVRKFSWWFVAVPLILYVPGMIWPVAVTLWLSRERLRLVWRHVSAKAHILNGLLAVILMAPLVYQLVHDSLRSSSLQSLVTWLGYNLHNGSMAGDAGQYFKNIGLLPWHLIGHAGDIIGPASPAVLAPLGVAVALLAVLGIAIIIRRWRENRWQFTLGLLVILWLVSGLGSLGIAAMLPLLYLAAGIGIAYLLSEWYRVFPRNPIARGSGLGLILVVVALSSIYNIRTYFVAWHYRPATRQTYVCSVEPPRAPGCGANQFLL